MFRKRRRYFKLGRVRIRWVFCKYLCDSSGEGCGGARMGTGNRLRVVFLGFFGKV